MQVHFFTYIQYSSKLKQLCVFLLCSNKTKGRFFSNFVTISEKLDFTCWRFVGHVRFGTTCCGLCILEGIEALSSILSLASELSAFLWVGFLFFLRLNVMISTRRTKMTKAPKHATRIYKVSFDITLELVASPETRKYFFS